MTERHIQLKKLKNICYNYINRLRYNWMLPTQIKKKKNIFAIHFYINSYLSKTQSTEPIYIRKILGEIDWTPHIKVFQFYIYTN